MNKDDNNEDQSTGEEDNVTVDSLSQAQPSVGGSSFLPEDVASEEEEEEDVEVPGTPGQTQLPVLRTPDQTQIPLLEGRPHLRRSPLLLPSHPQPARRATPCGDTSSSTESDAETDTGITDAARTSAPVPRLLCLPPDTPAPAATTQSQYVSHLPQHELPVGAACLLVQKKLKQNADARDQTLVKAALKLAKEQARSKARSVKTRSKEQARSEEQLAKSRWAPTTAAPPTTACAARPETLVTLPGIVPPPATTDTAHPTDSCVGRTVAIDPFSSRLPLDTLLTHIKKRAKYHDATTLPPESLESGKVMGVIKRRGQRQHLNSYNVEFKCRIFKSVMLRVTDVVPILVDSDTGLEPSTDEMDMNCTSHLLQRVPDSEQGFFPESDDEGVNVDLTNGDDCVKIIANSEIFTWNRRNQGDFAFTEQDFEDEAPAVPDDKVMKDLTLNWVEGGCPPEPTDKMKDTPGGLRKVCEKNSRSPVVSFMSALPLVFWKVSF
jgi:hypothetical protein